MTWEMVSSVYFVMSLCFFGVLEPRLFTQELNGAVPINGCKFASIPIVRALTMTDEYSISQPVNQCMLRYVYQQGRRTGLFDSSPKFERVRSI